MPKKGYDNRQLQTSRREAQEKKRTAQQDDDPIEQLSDSEGKVTAGADSKYRHRQIQSNWKKYDPEPSKIFEDDFEEPDESNDFIILANSAADCNYFQFKAEKEWQNEALNSTFSGNQFFNLDLDVLCNGLECIPFYERVGIDKNILLQSDIVKCDKKAEESMSRYKLISEEFLKKLSQCNELPDQDKYVPKSENVCKSENKQDTNNVPIELPVELDIIEQSLNEMEEDKDKKKSCSKDVKNNIEKIVGDENLEDWLDSVLDD